MIPNPNAPKPVPPGLDPEARTRLTKALDAMIQGWPATDETGVPITHIAEQELLSRLRRELPDGIPVDQIGLDEVRQVLDGHAEGSVRPPAIDPVPILE